MRYEQLIKKVETWSKARNLHNADVKYQFVKLIEEVGRLANGLNKGNYAVIKDSIGDSLVVLIIMCQQLNIDIQSALQWHTMKSKIGKGVW